LQKDEPAQGGNALDKLSGTGGGFDIFLLKNFCRVAPIVSNLGDIAFSPQVGFSPYNTTISQLCKISLTISNLLASIISLMRMGASSPSHFNPGGGSVDIGVGRGTIVRRRKKSIHSKIFVNQIWLPSLYLIKENASSKF
jgi:hypothetical protein